MRKFTADFETNVDEMIVEYGHYVKLVIQIILFMVIILKILLNGVQIKKKIMYYIFTI